MKKLILVTVLFFVTLLGQAQSIATVNVTTPGNFALQLINAGFTPSLVTELTVTGNLNDIDIQFMNSNMTTLKNLNLKDAELANNTFAYGAFLGKTSLISVSIPKSIVDFCKQFNGNVFNSCSNLSTIDFTNCSNLKSIDNGCFNGCSSLSSIDISPCINIETIGPNAFANSGIKNLDLSLTKIKTIGEYAFTGCQSLDTIILPASLISLGETFRSSSLQYIDFSRCVSLETINNFDAYNLLTLDLSSCVSLKSFSSYWKFPVTKVKNIDFSKCNLLTSVSFENMSGLTDVILPSSVRDINSFSGCSSLQMLTVKRSLPPTLSVTNVFNSVPQNACKLIVPKGSKTNYMIASQWGNFLVIEEADFPNALNEVVNIKFNPYPNPAKQIINLPYQLEKGKQATMKIVDINGKQIISKLIDSSFDKLLLDVSEYQKGLYMYEYNGKSGKFLVE